MLEHASSKQAVQEPAWLRKLASVEAFAIDPEPHPFAALDAEIIPRQRAALRVVPPFHGDALGPFRMGDLVQHAPPAKPHRRSVGNFRDRLDRLRPSEQTNRPRRAEAILVQTIFVLRRGEEEICSLILRSALLSAWRRMRASRRMAAGYASILRDAVLRTAPQDEVRRHGRDREF